jgi:hypothetical protein
MADLSVLGHEIIDEWQWTILARSCRTQMPMPTSDGAKILSGDAKTLGSDVVYLRYGVSGPAG